MTIKDSTLSTRAKNALRRNGITTHADLQRTTDLTRLHLIGPTLAKEIRQWQREQGRLVAKAEEI